MRLIVRENASTASKYVAEYIVERIKAFNPTPSNPFVLGLPTGSSPEQVYKYLVQMYKNGEISFKNVVTFNMDEYVALPQAHPESYHTFMYTHLFSHVDIPPSQVNILNGNAPDLEAECIKYEEKIARAGGIELFLGGIGANGHIAFNEPGSSLQSRTRVKTLDYDTVVANSRFFNGDIEKVPKMALTVGVATILDAREVLILATGSHKALAIAQSLDSPLSHQSPLSSLQLHPQALIIVDEPATNELKVKTVKYYKSIEAVAIASNFPQTLRPKVELEEKKRRVCLELDRAGGNSLRVESAGGGGLTFARAPTPELRPDAMNERLAKSLGGGNGVVNGLGCEDGFLENMGSRVAAH